MIIYNQVRCKPLSFYRWIINKSNGFLVLSAFLCWKFVSIPCNQIALMRRVLPISKISWCYFKFFKRQSSAVYVAAAVECTNVSRIVNSTKFKNTITVKKGGDLPSTWRYTSIWVYHYEWLGSLLLDAQL